MAARAPIPISLNSTTCRIAVHVDDAAAMVPEASLGAAGAADPALSAFEGPRPLPEAIDGAGNTDVAAPSTIAFSLSTKDTGFYAGLGPRIPARVSLVGGLLITALMPSAGPSPLSHVGFIDLKLVNPGAIARKLGPLVGKSD